MDGEVAGLTLRAPSQAFRFAPSDPRTDGPERLRSCDDEDAVWPPEPREEAGQATDAHSFEESFKPYFSVTHRTIIYLTISHYLLCVCSGGDSSVEASKVQAASRLRWPAAAHSGNES